LIIVLFPIAWPISKVLDWLFGGDHVSFFKRAELKELVNLHVAKDKASSSEGADMMSPDIESTLSKEEAAIISGALDLKTKIVADVMTPIEEVFMLESKQVMDRHTMGMILKSGHSRVPVCKGTRTNIIGMVLIKRLLKLSPDDNVPVESLELLRLPTVPEYMELYPMIKLFQSGKSHMALVVSGEDHTTVKGIITLEDLIEELLQDEIKDETDRNVSVEVATTTSGWGNKRGKSITVTRTLNPYSGSEHKPPGTIIVFSEAVKKKYLSKDKQDLWRR